MLSNVLHRAQKLSHGFFPTSLRRSTVAKQTKVSRSPVSRPFSPLQFTSRDSSSDSLHSSFVHDDLSDKMDIDMDVHYDASANVQQESCLQDQHLHSIIGTGHLIHKKKQSKPNRKLQQHLANGIEKYLAYQPHQVKGEPTHRVAKKKKFSKSRSAKMARRACNFLGSCTRRDRQTRKDKKKLRTQARRILERKRMKKSKLGGVDGDNILTKISSTSKSYPTLARTRKNVKNLAKAHQNRKNREVRKTSPYSPSPVIEIRRQDSFARHVRSAEGLAATPTKYQFKGLSDSKYAVAAFVAEPMIIPVADPIVDEDHEMTDVPVHAVPEIPTNPPTLTVSPTPTVLPMLAVPSSPNALSMPAGCSTSNAPPTSAVSFTSTALQMPAVPSTSTALPIRVVSSPPAASPTSAVSSTPAASSTRAASQILAVSSTPAASTAASSSNPNIQPLQAQTFIQFLIEQLCRNLADWTLSDRPGDCQSPPNFKRHIYHYHEDYPPPKSRCRDDIRNIPYQEIKVHQEHNEADNGGAPGPSSQSKTSSNSPELFGAGPTGVASQPGLPTRNGKAADIYPGVSQACPEVEELKPDSSAALGTTLTPQPLPVKSVVASTTPNLATQSLVIRPESSSDDLELTMEKLSLNPTIFQVSKKPGTFDVSSSREQSSSSAASGTKSTSQPLPVNSALTNATPNLATQSLVTRPDSLSTDLGLAMENLSLSLIICQASQKPRTFGVSGPKTETAIKKTETVTSVSSTSLQVPVLSAASSSLSNDAPALNISLTPPDTSPAPTNIEPSQIYASSRNRRHVNGTQGRSPSRSQHGLVSVEAESKEARREAYRRHMHQVPQEFQGEMHDVINSVGDGTMSPRMSDRSVRSIPDLVNQGPGAKVAPFRGKRLSEEEEQQIRGYLRDIRNHHFPIWLGLMMKVLQSGRTPKKLLRKKYHEILGGEWVLDYERIDRIARGDIRFACEKYFDSNCVGKELREEFAGTFDEAYSKIEDGGLRVFGELITEWAMKCKESRSKTDVMLFSMFVACVCKAGWVEAEPKYGQFIRWSQEMAPEPLKSVCREHFRWAFPRLFCDVYPGMLDMFKDDEDIVQRPLLEQNLAERRVASSHQHLSV